MIFLRSVFKDISEDPLWKQQIKLRIDLREINLKVWSETNLFSPVWWGMLVLFFVLWFTWWKLVDKTRLLEIVAFGLLVSLLTTVTDTIATQEVIWGYPNKLTPFSPPILFEDLCVLPVLFMFIYQYFTGWKAFAKALLVLALIMSFIIEPLGVRFDIFELNHWKYIYSFPVYLFNGFLLRWIICRIISRQQQIRG